MILTKSSIITEMTWKQSFSIMTPHVSFESIIVNKCLMANKTNAIPSGSGHLKTNVFEIVFIAGFRGEHF